MMPGKERMLKNRICVAVMFILAASFASAQEDQPAAVDRAAQAEEHLRLAVSSLDYPVTPGDQYRLTYRQTGDTIIVRDVLVEADSTIDLGIFGKINAYGLRFIELKQGVEALIQSGYTRSMPNLSISSPGVFRVSVTGDIRQSRYVTVWGLSRLSEVVMAVREEYSSLRSVVVISATGERRRFDLLKALRLGLVDQDPYVKPGDVIVLSNASRTVVLSGEVRQPGSYELLEGEGLKDLVESFGQGFTFQANLDRLRIDRNTDGRGSAEYYSYGKALEDGIALNDRDAVIVGSKLAARSIVWFVGAVSLPPESEGANPASAAPAAELPEQAAGQAAMNGLSRSYNRFMWRIHEGEYLSDLLRDVSDYMLPAADLGAAVIFRAGAAAPITVDMDGLLSGLPGSSDLMIVANDVVYIPEMRSTITVAGAVITPGSYLYRPGAPASYYVSLAGGFDPERSSGGVFRVYGPTGKARRIKDPIMAGDQIFVPSNAFGYILERNAPLLVTIATVLVNLTTLYFMLSGR